MRQLFRALLIASLMGLLLPAIAQPSVRLTLTSFATGLGKVVDITHPPGENRLYVVDKAGRIRIVTPSGAVLPTPFLDIVARVVSTGAEQGLLGLAFHPNYATNGYFYVNYITPGGPAGTTRISRFQRSATSPDLAVATSELLIFSVDQPFSNHNGGTLQFGPDGYLYAGLGDGGSGNDPGNRAQNLATPLGKILRFDIDNPSGGLNYGIPPTNPLINTMGALPEIWLWGVRNPWRTSFDSATGAYWVGDVGQSAREEIDVMVDSVDANHNFGWRCREGMQVGVGGSSCLAVTAYHQPVFDYSRSNVTGGASVTGGYVYRGTRWPTLTGRYVFADYVSGNFWTITRQGSTYVAKQDSLLHSNGITCFGQDSAGELYCGKLAGTIARLSVVLPTGLPASAERPTLRLHPNPATSTCRLDLPEAVAADIEVVSLLTGQVLRRTRSEAATAAATLDVRGLAAGLYGVRAYLPGRTITQRLLVRGE